MKIHQLAKTALVAVSLLILGFSSPVIAQEVLFGTSGDGPSDLYSIDPNTGFATLIGSTGALDRVTGLTVIAESCTAFGMNGRPNDQGANLVSVNLVSGLATDIGVITGSGFDGGIGGGAGSIASSAAGELYVGTWNGGITNGGLVQVNPATAAVLAANQTTGGAFLAGLAFDLSGTLWVSRGGNNFGQIHTIDKTNGNILTTVSLSDASAKITDIAFSSNGTMYGALTVGGTSSGDGTSSLVTINNVTGQISVVGSMGSVKMSSLSFTPAGCFVPRVVPSIGLPGKIALVALLMFLGLMAFRVRGYQA